MEWGSRMAVWVLSALGQYPLSSDFITHNIVHNEMFILFIIQKVCVFISPFCSNCMQKYESAILKIIGTRTVVGECKTSNQGPIPPIWIMCVVIKHSFQIKI